jgi:hypothetical protein
MACVIVFGQLVRIGPLITNWLPHEAVVRARIIVIFGPLARIGPSRTRWAAVRDCRMGPFHAR